MSTELRKNLKNFFLKKNPGTPEFIIDIILYLSKGFTREKDIGKLLSENKTSKGIEFSNAVLRHFDVKYNVIGEIPHEGRNIFTCNHPLGAIDANVLISSVGEKNKNLKIIVNDSLSFLKNYEDIFLPIDINGKQNRNYAKNISNSLKSDSQILIFPSGSISRKVNRKIRDSEWMPSIINWAVKYKREIVPTYLNGECSKLFYGVSKVRKKLGIKKNLEEFLLSREAFLQRGKNFNIVFGEPISYTNFTKDLSPKEWIKKVYDITYLLGEN
ncbi:MAG: 1-acyl-sn-glycerol-3-phosphate acyltransferase [Nanoarchaeota archaeon]|nr:1-acyl-sn-glycerol-3-phosphate acyltransferase [Nanoarchaeota archaeon]